MRRDSRARALALNLLTDRDEQGNAGDYALGLGDTTPRGNANGTMGDKLPFVNLGAGRVPTAVTTGTSHTCVLFDTKRVGCWGAGISGALGLGSTSNVGSTPAEMGNALALADFGGDVVSVKAGKSLTCAVLVPAKGSVVKCVVRFQWGGGVSRRRDSSLCGSQD